MTSETVRRAVKDALMTNPKVDAAEIAISVDKSGVVTLQGTVGSLREKIEAGLAAQRVPAVNGVTNALEVRLLIGDRREDAEVRGAVLQALRLNSLVPATIDARVHDGMVTLEGRARWPFERDEAELVASKVRGVRGVHSQIVIEPAVRVTDIKEAIARAFARQAAVDVDRLTIEHTNGTVILRGFVSSWSAHDAAINAVRSVPGVTQVEDQIEIND